MVRVMHGAHLVVLSCALTVLALLCYDGAELACAICGIYNLSLILFCCSIPYVAKRSKVRMHHVDGLQLTARIGALTPPFS